MKTYMCRVITRKGDPKPPFLVHAPEPFQAAARATLKCAGEDYRALEIWNGEERVIAMSNPGIPKSVLLS